MTTIEPLCTPPLNIPSSHAPADGERIGFPEYFLKGPIDQGLSASEQKRRTQQVAVVRRLAVSRMSNHQNVNLDPNWNWRGELEVAVIWPKLLFAHPLEYEGTLGAPSCALLAMLKEDASKRRLLSFPRAKLL